MSNPNNSEGNLNELQQRAIAFRQRILDEIAAKYKKQNSAAKERLRSAAAAVEEAEAELEAAEKARREEAWQIRTNRAKAKRDARAQETRKRHPGANWEIIGRPPILARGAPFRPVEGRTAHPRMLAITRGRRNTANYTRRRRSPPRSPPRSSRRSSRSPSRSPPRSPHSPPYSPPRSPSRSPSRS